MSEQHTKEPWKVSGTEHIVAGGNYVVALDCKPEDARRIVACVNACAGFSIEELEGASLFNDSISAQDEIDSLKSEVEDMKLIIATDTGTESAVAAMQKQRDELLAALESILPEFRQHSLRNLRDDETSENHRCRVFDHDDHLYEIANKVIASVKANT